MLESCGTESLSLFSYIALSVFSTQYSTSCESRSRGSFLFG